MNIEDLIGTTLGTCTIERMIGHGGMGAVFLAQQCRPARPVAVKILIPADSGDPHQQQIFLARFQREADTIAKLEHSNIVPIYEYAEATVRGQQIAYLVMPYIQGGTLRDCIQDKQRKGEQFELTAVAHYISQIADALTYAHSLGIVHRDIKPGNLLFHQDGRLLLSDFGIVRLQSSPSLTITGSFIGTAEYASPEQINSGEVDARSDIYSLGIILYELLTGHVPFMGASPFAIMMKHLTEAIPAIRNDRPDLSPAIETVVMKALARNPADRYQSVRALADDMRSATTATMNNSFRLHTDNLYADPTIPELVYPLQMPASGIASERTLAATPIPPTPWQQSLQERAQAQRPLSPYPLAPPLSYPAAKTYRQGHRLCYYGVIVIALLLQFPIFLLLYTPIDISNGLSAMLGVVLGIGTNLLILAAVGFVLVIHNRSAHKRGNKFIYFSLANIIIVAIISGWLISFGSVAGSIHPLLAYLVLLLSNLFAIRQLAKADPAQDQVEVARVLWRPAIVGALTGFLPLTIILIFALTTTMPLMHLLGNRPLGRLFDTLIVALIGSPTPGAMMAVWLSQKMTFPVFLRTSAVAGLLMFFGAFLLVVIWILTLSRGITALNTSENSWIAFLVIAGILGIIGSLRGMLDAWIYWQIKQS